MKEKELNRFIEDVELSTNAPKWIKEFREKYYQEMTLPFLIVYQATPIFTKRGTILYKNKGAAIAIATKYLQKNGLLLKDTNTLSASGDLREIATMRKLGKEKTKEYIKKFESM